MMCSLAGLPSEIREQPVSLAQVSAFTISRCVGRSWRGRGWVTGHMYRQHREPAADCKAVFRSLLSPDGCVTRCSSAVFSARVSDNWTD